MGRAIREPATRAAAPGIYRARRAGADFRIALFLIRYFAPRWLNFDDRSRGAAGRVDCVDVSRYDLERVQCRGVCRALWRRGAEWRHYGRQPQPPALRRLAEVSQ